MQCLYCGKELALLKRLTGSEFCSDAHKRSYQEEYNRLAVSRLLQAQPKAETPPTPLRRQRGVEAEAPEFLEGGKRRIEAPKPEPAPEPAPVSAVSQATAVPIPMPAVGNYQPEPMPVVETPQQAETPAASPGPAPQPIPTADVDPVPTEMAGFLADTLPIRDSELRAGLNMSGPSEIKARTHYPSYHPLAQPIFETLPMADLVGYEAGIAFYPGEPVMASTSAEITEFASMGPGLDIPTRPSPPRGLGSADKVRFMVTSRKSAESTCQSQTETADFVIAVTFRETTRSEPAAGIDFPAELAGLAEAMRPAVETPPEEAPEPDSPRAALKALSKLSEEVKTDSGSLRGKRNNGANPAPSEAEPAIDTAAVEWLFSNRPGSRSEPDHPASKPSRSRRQDEESVPVQAGEPAQLEPAAAHEELVAVASEAVLAVAVEESEAVRPDVQEAAPEVPKTPQFVTIPVKLFVPSKPRLAPGSQAIPAHPAPELPRIEAQPLRPKMALSSAPAETAAVSNGALEPRAVEVDTPVADAPIAAAPAEPDSAPALAEVPPKVASRPVFEKVSTATAAPPEPPKEQAGDPKRSVWKTTTILKTEESPVQTAATSPASTKSKQEISPAQTPEESGITVPGLSFATAGNSSFWGALPLAAKITILAIVVIIVAAVIYLTSFNHKNSASADTVGPSIIMGEGGWVTDWAGDATGLHRGRQITIYKPSLKLSDYRISFQGRVENASIGWVFRAADASNYYVMKLTQASSGFKLMKYAVVNGQEHEQGSVAVPPPSAGWFSIRVDVRGPKFNTFIDNQPLDVWTDEQLKTGGVGFLNDRGERADIKGIAISYLAGVGK
jgi:hypothetical protein